MFYYSIFRNGMKFKSKTKTLNHIIYTSIWKPNRSGHSMLFGNFCFLEPLTSHLGSKKDLNRLIWNVLHAMEREKCFLLQYSLAFPLILGVEVVEITQDFSLCLQEVQWFYSFSWSLCFTKAIYKEQLHEMRSPVFIKRIIKRVNFPSQGATVNL